MISIGALCSERSRGPLYGYYRALTIDHTLCGSSDSSNFPVLVSLTDATLKSVANGGHVNNASGFDIAFSSDSAGLTLIPFELVNYNAATGAIEFWVSVATLSHTTDTVIYMQYGGTSITDHSNKAGVWASAYKAVYHLGDGTTLNLTDSSQSGNNLTNVGGTATGGASRRRDRFFCDVRAQHVHNGIAYG